MRSRVNGDVQNLEGITFLHIRITKIKTTMYLGDCWDFIMFLNLNPIPKKMVFWKAIQNCLISMSSCEHLFRKYLY